MKDLPAKQLIQHWREGGVLSSNNIYTLVGEYEDLERKLKVAREALEKMRLHSGRTIYDYEDLAKSALKEIEVIP